MVRIILDTSFLLDLEDGDEGAFGRAVELYEQGTVQRVAMPSVWELHYGAAYTGSMEERRRVQNLLSMYPPVAIDEETARKVGRTAGKRRPACRWRQRCRYRGRTDRSRRPSIRRAGPDGQREGLRATGRPVRDVLEPVEPAGWRWRSNGHPSE